MPFDALVMRAVTRELEPSMVGSVITDIRDTPEAVYISGRTETGMGWHLECGLDPRLKRLLAVRQVPKRARAAAWAEALVHGRVRGVRQPAWERIWIWDVTPDDAWSPEPLTLVIELSGHLTNLLWLRQDGTVGDARRRIAPDRPGRPVWPGLTYVPPPRPGNPCTVGDSALLPPWARQRVETGPDTLEDWCRAYELARFRPYLYRQPGRPLDVWVAPGPGAEPFSGSWSDALYLVSREQEQALRLAEARRQALAHLRRRLDRLDARLRELEAHAEDDPDVWRRLGNSVLALGAGWETVPSVVPDLEHGGMLAIPEDWRHLGYAAIAEHAYHRYKKARARREADGRILPRLLAERAAVERQLAEAAITTNLEWLRGVQSQGGSTAGGGGKALPYRRFVTASGFEVWVGRTEVENQTLTFRDARPDDLWFHVKQYPGSHVILRSGKAVPSHEDLLDAATLAAFYSKARTGSAVPVDYTARKFVRKRPRGAPGQVLYTRERTLYVTPDPARLERLGARRDRLAD
jgi:hypothetical protein